ncbi:polysaccharide biosynthesis/export family protein [Pedobacter frigiditerrae]|uniref:polysaccharide biosynthesis/export family protein n=1 Tax=Pedobacter frigiditerrae TaxID=2530452 RepID=UPI0029306518|nr:polysaccharide biosynthesis/export family protein [Pedobacter frigiditerrae]
MNKTSTTTTISLLLVITCTIFLSSCGTTKHKTYFGDLDTSKIAQLPLAEFKEPLIQVDDIISISVQTVDVASSAALNQAPVLTAAAAGTAGSIGGFLVDKAGNVEMPILGVLKLKGLSTAQAKEVVRERAAKYYKDPTVQVRFANYKITIIGEVARPAAYNLPNEKVSVLDAISMAGDLTVFGKRENVLLMREIDGRREMIRLDLSSSKVLTSPYFYLKQNDVLYVEATKAKFSANDAPRNQLISIGVSLAAFAITIFRLF